MAPIPGTADVRIQQSRANPGFDIEVDRTRAQYVGLTERDVTNSLVVNLAGSGQVSPTYWLSPNIGFNVAGLAIVPLLVMGLTAFLLTEIFT